MSEGIHTVIERARRFVRDMSSALPGDQPNMTVEMVRALLGRVDALESVLKEACDDLDFHGYKSGFRLRIKGGIDQ